MRKAIFVGSLILLTLAVPATAANGVIFSGIDIWATRGDGTTFTDFKFEPIPAGFFCANSAPFAGRIVFQGAPIATEEARELGNADTIVHRLDDAALDKRGRGTTRIQVRALSLVSTAPIKTSCGSFSVKAVLDGDQPVTRMRIFRENEKGGFYVAPLALNVKLLFTPAARPHAHPLALKQSVRFSNNPPLPWVSEHPEGRSVVHEAAVKVDTDGDGRPDTSLPGTSNFIAGVGAQNKLRDGCHMFTDVTGLRKMHCVDSVEPAVE
jgi:hypothetical protein